MNDNCRIYHNVFLLATIFCFVCLGFSCGKKGDRSQDEKTQGELQRKLTSYMSKPDQEIVALLATKYGKDVNLVEEMVDLYLTETDFIYKNIKNLQERDKGKLTQAQFEESVRRDSELMLHLIDKSAYAELVAIISRQFSLEPSIVASILLDYKIWKAAEKAGRSGSSSE